MSDEIPGDLSVPAAKVATLTLEQSDDGGVTMKATESESLPGQIIVLNGEGVPIAMYELGELKPQARGFLQQLKEK
ncbi:hypothetical protein [Nonomuraea typhae]|uniref:Uncharacterized protein n=1 Tax=Nonomuraea typhae TaxID=2603600 RepID=A0ABW7ZCQ9_9ACTN